MGCINNDQGFSHWFGNIHFSGPCNRSCYFCIGQHMMALDAENNLDKWPLDGLDDFINKCLAYNVNEINVTGTNTDPLLYRHMSKLKEYLKERIPNLIFGLRTNGALILTKPEIWALFDKASITVCSLDPIIYKKMMGQGSPSDLEKIKRIPGPLFKINTVLGPENIKHDVFETIRKVSDLGIYRMNLREPYGQANIGNPLSGVKPSKMTLGMPTYDRGHLEVTYWDVHYVEVESVNLYAQGRVSLTYPITLGHDEVTGKVLDQSNFKGGRVNQQWISA